MVQPMSFDRIGKLGNSDTMKTRLREEARLVDLAQSTRGSAATALVLMLLCCCLSDGVVQGLPLSTWEAADQAAQAIEAAGPGVLGFDIEWQVSFVKGQAAAPTATLQLCAPEQADVDAPTSVKSSPVWGTAYIFHLIHIRGGWRHPSSSSDVAPQKRTVAACTDELASKEAVAVACTNDLASKGAMAVACKDADKEVVIGDSRRLACLPDDKEVVTAGSHRVACLPESLVRVLSDPRILLAGIGVNGDVYRLEKEYEQLRACGVNGVVDLSLMANMKEDPELRRRGMWSLSDLCAQVLDLDLAKPDALRKGSWEKRPLNLDQLFYAAADAYAGLRLWQVMKAMPDLPILRPSTGDGRVVESGGVGQGSAGGYCSAETGAGVDGRHGKTSARPALGTGRAARQVRLPQSKLETHRMWYEGGLSVEAVAEARCIKTSTILGYLADDTRSTLVSKHDNKHDGIQGVTSGRCPNGAIGASVAHAGVCGAVAAVAPAEDSVKRQRRLVDSCGSLGVGCVMTDGLSRANCLGHSQGERGGGVGTGAGKYSGRWQRQGDGRDSDPGKVGTTIRDGAEEVEANATRRWDYVGLREVRDLAPGVEYWQIRMVLAKFKSGWCECPGSE
eukprot:jgi/Undpi1/9832/HiC_scaffold_27.g12286.m1